MKTAVIYARYSSERQTEQSIEGQVHTCRDFAASKGYVILDEYIDRATTGTNDNRPSFQQMLQDSDKKIWDVVLVYKLDRFSRNKYEMATHRKHLRDNGVKLISATENIPDTPEGIILESMLEGMAEYYSAELSQKVKRGLNENRLKGNFTGGHVPYGFKVVDKKVLIEEDQANVVRYIYQQTAAGVMVKDIIEDLHKQGVTFNGIPIARNTVYRILNNEKYAGLYHYKDELYTNMYPQIVDIETYNIVRSVLDDNKRKGRTGNVPYLLRDKLYCGYCGKPITSETGTDRSGVVQRYYKCTTRRKNKSCKKENVRKDVLEQCIIDTLKKIFLDKETMSKLADDILAIHNKRHNQMSILKVLLKQKSKVDSSIDNLLEAIEKGILTASTKKRLEKLEAEQAELDEKITIEKSKLSQQLTKKDIVSFLKKGIENKDYILIKTLVRKVILYDNKIEIYMNYPRNKDDTSDDNNQRCLLYKTTTTGYTLTTDRATSNNAKVNISMYC